MIFLTQHINFLYSYFRIHNIVTNIMTTLLWKYSDFRVFLDDKYNHYYNNNKYFKWTVDYSYYMYYNIKKRLLNESTLPEENAWHNFIYLNEIDNKYKYVETYEILNNTICNETQYIESVKLSSDYLNDSLNHNLCCMLSKYNNSYVVRNQFLKLKKTDYFKKSNVSILSIVYSHPKMEQKIHIELPKEMLYCYNQLFNAAFVYFCLKYFNKEKFIFDENYNVEIMDSNVETMNITYHYYLYIGLDHFEVKQI